MGQSSASKIRRRVREREQVARFIAPFIFDEELNLYEDDDGRWRIECPHCEPWPTELRYGCIACSGAGSTPAEDALTLGLVVSPDPGRPRQRLTFHVHDAREAAEALVRLEVDQEIFEDWCRARGLGPENREPGAFGGWCPGSVIRVREDGLSEMRPCPETQGCTHDLAARGGWPGKLAREWVWKRCPNKCERGPMAARYYENGPPGEIDVCRECTDGRVRHRDPRAPMGRSLARLGRRVLAALEGQPSECQARNCERGTCRAGVERGQEHPPPGSKHVRVVDGSIRQLESGRWTWRYHCLVCEGTGHNLRGALPAVENIPAVRRALADSVAAVESVVDDYENLASWQRPIVEALDMADECADEWLIFQGADTSLHVETRVVPRGEHRFSPARGKDDPPWTLDQRISGGGWAPKSKRAAAEDFDPIFACLPAWRRGETRAQETRFRRAWEAVGEEYEGQWWMPRPDPLEAAIDAVVELAIAREAAE